MKSILLVSYVILLKQIENCVRQTVFYKYRGSPPNAKNGTRKNTALREIALCEVTIM